MNIILVLSVPRLKELGRILTTSFRVFAPENDSKTVCLLHESNKCYFKIPDTKSLLSLSNVN